MGADPQTDTPSWGCQGGLFVFDGADVLYAHKDEGTADHAPMEDVLAACCKVQA